MVKRTVIFLILLATLAATFSFADVRSYIDRSELYNDESLVLSVIVSPKGELNDDDMAKLERQFFIDQRSQQQMTQIINGKRSSQVEYRFRITPKQIGAITIPSFRVGNDQSEPLLVNVIDSRNRKDSLGDDDVLLSVTSSTTEPYIDQPFIITVELAYKIQLSGRLADISVDNFDTEVVNNEQTQEVRNGRVYYIYRQSVRFTPKAAGAFSIPPVRFSGQYVNQQTRRYERVSRVADIGVINVKPIPNDYPAGAYWLPLKNLTLTENVPDQVTVDSNEYVDWTLTLTADGLSGRQLPDPLSEFESTLHPDIRLYRDAPEFTDNQRIDKQSLSVIKGGSYTLPTIRIPWWNVTEDRLMWLETHKKVINVNQSAAPTTQPARPVNSADNSDVTTSQTPLANSTASKHFGIWLWMLTAVLILLSLASIFILWRSKHNATSSANEADKPKPVVDLVELAQTGAMSSLYQQSLYVINEKGITLAEAKQKLTPENQATFVQLETHLFENSANAPSSSELLSLVKEVMTLSKQKTNAKQVNFDLYPS